MSDVRLTRAAATTRRSLTPSAWLVLEELALAADHAAVASTNARALAAALGMSKDTTARALQRLIASALVERVEHRSLATGQFASIAYRVNLRAAGLEVDAARMRDEGPGESTAPEGRAATRQRSTHRTASRSARRQDEPTPTSGDQLDLFGA